MLFSDLTFIFVFLPITVALYYLFSFHTVTKNTLLLVASLLFYAWGEPRVVFVLLGAVMVNYILGLLVDFWKDRQLHLRVVLVLTCVFNIGLLFIYKYLAFVVESFYGLISRSVDFVGLAVPIGISFFALHAISYVFDVYHERVNVQKNPFDLALYLMAFPHVMAGPIVRYSTMVQQISSRKETWNKFSLGCCRFVMGLGKKVLIANIMALMVSTIFTLNEASLVPVSLAWLGAIAFMLQIFFDLSGYADMAIGLGLIFGFRYQENFNYPYIAKSATEFWLRWYISLTGWFKTYVYIPLGGSQTKNKDIMVRNLLIVWLCVGLWHGACWTMVLWGIWNFLFLLAEKILDVDELTIPTWMRHTYTLLFALFGCVLFRAGSCSVALGYFAAMFGGSGLFWSDYTGMLLREYGVYFLVAVALCAPVGRRMNYYIAQNRRTSWLYHTLYPVALLAVFVLSASYLMVGSYNPFEYFIV